MTGLSAAKLLVQSQAPTPMVKTTAPPQRIAMTLNTLRIVDLPQAGVAPLARPAASSLHEERIEPLRPEARRQRSWRNADENRAWLAVTAEIDPHGGIG
jgi:hypothetical protein